MWEKCDDDEVFFMAGSIAFNLVLALFPNFLEPLFLVTVTIHSMLGLRAILFDLGFPPTTERRITMVVAGSGTLMVAYGVWLLWAVAV